MASSRLNVLCDVPHPIRRTIVLVPDKLEKADKGNIASLSWEIQQQAKEQGGADLATRVGSLSPAAIEELIRTPRYGGMGFVSSNSAADGTQGYLIPSADRLSGFRELEAAQLIKFSEPLDSWQTFIATVPLREDDPGSISYGRAMWPTQPLTPEQRQRIDMQDYRLTTKGSQAVDAIVKALGEQLKAR